MFISQDYPPALGGSQTYSHALAHELYRLCEDFCVLAPDQPGAAAFDAKQVFETVRVRSSSDWMRVRELPALVRTARERRSNVVLTGQWNVAAAALVARRLGLVDRVFVAAHGQELLKSLVPAPLTPLYDAHRRQVLNAADGLFPVSHYTGELIARQGVDPARIHVVCNGTDLARFTRPDIDAEAARLRARLGIPDGPLLVTVARLVSRKGIDTVIEALARLAPHHTELRYLIAGEGPEETSLRALAARLGVADRCHFAGRVSDEEVPAAYRAGDIFVMPSRAVGPSVEGFGLSLCEAGACERPAVGSYSGGIPDAVVDGETGLLVPPDDPEALADALGRLLDDPALAVRLGKQGRSRIEREGTWTHAATAIYRHMEQRPPRSRAASRASGRAA